MMPISKIGTPVFCSALRNWAGMTIDLFKLSLDYLVGLCAKAGVSVALKLAA